ncbi:MAG: NAD(P)H-hydrate epimerase [Nitrososphaerota archaeon]|nr:NAD(P)H-hydrate epimerase [Nitrososphaerota archaeon]MDG7024799.1 NAD(P)H-hydrate epimerase [Nitrososphaerota archaeon]
MRTQGDVVFLTAQEMAELDRSAIEEFGIDELVLMENAGLAVANAARRLLGGDTAGKKIGVLVGKGNNGGDGLVAARHLQNWGAQVSLVLAGDRADLKALPAKHLEIVEKMGALPVGPESGLRGAHLLVDALLGYNLKGDPKEPLAGLIRRANASKTKILAVDIPSGLDATTGDPGEPCIAADTTVTLGLPKVGFLSPGARKYVGRLYLADISFPNLLYARYAQKAGLFGRDTLVAIW